MIIIPDYYPEFKCISNQCKHNCCIGWEIDIDNETFEKYSKINGDFGKKLSQSISNENGCHFVLTNQERCPFLNEQGLCDIIITLGEENLCQICSDHPRFRNYIGNRIEMGIGLCCEAAAKLILFKETKTTFNNESSIDTDFINVRNKIYEILQNRTKSINDRVSEMLDFCKVPSPISSPVNWEEVFFSLERLDAEWVKYISRITPESYMIKTKNELDIPYEQLLIYLVYRHLSPAVEDGMFTERISFIALSFYIIKSINTSQSLEELLEIARMYSSEIEYSDQNIETLLDILSD